MTGAHALRLRVRACPLCGAAGEIEAQHLDPDWERYRLPAQAVPLRRCPGCGMRFYDLIEDVNTEGQIYARELLSATRVRPRHRALARLIQRTGLGLRGLELGAGACHVGRLLPPEYSMTAVDSNPRGDGAPAHVRFLAADITALAEDMFAPGAFDFVLLDNVLEHLPVFDGLLARARHWLAADGRIIVSVPNGRTLKRLLGRRHLRDVHRPVEHVNIFDGASLDAALAKVGCRPAPCLLPPRSAFEAGVAASLLGWAPFGLYRMYAP